MPWKQQKRQQVYVSLCRTLLERTRAAPRQGFSLRNEAIKRRFNRLVDRLSDYEGRRKSVRDGVVTELGLEIPVLYAVPTKAGHQSICVHLLHPVASV